MNDLIVRSLNKGGVTFRNTQLHFQELKRGFTCLIFLLIIASLTNLKRVK